MQTWLISRISDLTSKWKNRFHNLNTNLCRVIDFRNWGNLFTDPKEPWRKLAGGLTMIKNHLFARTRMGNFLPSTGWVSSILQKCPNSGGSANKFTGKSITLWTEWRCPQKIWFPTRKLKSNVHFVLFRITKNAASFRPLGHNCPPNRAKFWRRWTSPQQWKDCFEARTRGVPAKNEKIFWHLCVDLVIGRGCRKSCQTPQSETSLHFWNLG